MRRGEGRKFTISESPGSKERVDLIREEGDPQVRVEVDSYSYGAGFTAWVDLGDLLYGLGVTAEECRESLVRRVGEEGRRALLSALLRDGVWAAWCQGEGKDGTLGGWVDDPGSRPAEWRPPGWKGDRAEVDEAIASGWKIDPTIP